jgi:hypothetical protein
MHIVGRRWPTVCAYLTYFAVDLRGLTRHIGGMRLRIASGPFGLVPLALLLGGCAGVQGGTEGEGTGDCFYEDVPLDDPDEVADGFEASPRELFASTQGRFEGVVKGHAAVLEVTADFDDLTALYDQDEGDDVECGPHLATGAEFALTLDEGESSAVSAVSTPGHAGLEVRWGYPLASASFEIAPESELAALVPDFTAEPIGDATLQIWLNDTSTDPVESQWRWSAPIDCTGRDLCSGYDEVDWGKAMLDHPSR